MTDLPKRLPMDDMPDKPFWTWPMIILIGINVIFLALIGIGLWLIVPKLYLGFQNMV